MQNKIEQIISIVYKTWNKKLRHRDQNCPDEETFACFFEGRLSKEEDQRLKDHLIGCDKCLELIMAVSQKAEELSLPEDLISRAKNMIAQQQNFSVAFLEIVLGFSDKTIDIIKTSGDILFGQEFAPLPVLRSRNIKDFGREVIIVKDLGTIKTEIEIENKANHNAKVAVKLTDKNTGRPAEGLRITLLRKEEELESYIAHAGKAVFDDVLVGSYIFEVSSTELIIGKILLNINRV